MPDDFEITGIHLADQRPIAGKLLLLCTFDMRCRGFQFQGCSLLKTTRNGFIIWGPKVENPRGNAPGVVVEDEALRHRISDAVRARYAAFGGRYDVSHTSPGDKPRGTAQVLTNSAQT